MAASMILKGISRVRKLCVVHHELETVYTLQRQQFHFSPTYRVVHRVKKQTRKKKVIQEKEKKFLHEKPLYDIYMMEDYPPQKFPLNECIAMHKEAAQPAMTNTLQAQVYADIELDFKTTKKAKFMKNIRGLLEFPHNFVHDQKKNIFVFSEVQSDVDLCKELGVSTVGGEDLIGYINQGIMRKDDIESCDFLFSTPAMAVKLLKMRSLLMDKTPTLSNGCIISDFEPVLKKHMEGVKYKSHKESEGIGRVQVPFGQLYQEMDKLEENFSYMISVLSSLKPPKQDPLLKTMRMIAPPSPEIFVVDLDTYIKPSESTSKSVPEEDSDDED